MSHELDRSRRHALASLSALSLAGLPPLQALAQAKLTVGVIYVGPKDDYGYNQAQAAAAAEMKKLPGIKVVSGTFSSSTTLMPGNFFISAAAAACAWL